MNTMLSKKIPQDITRRLFSSITDKEVVEAVRHVHEREKKVRAPKLDRTRVLLAYHDFFSHFPTIQGFLTGKNYSYCVVGQNDIERANTLLYDTFYPGEPITKYLGLAQVTNIIQHFFLWV